MLSSTLHRGQVAWLALGDVWEIVAAFGGCNGASGFFSCSGFFSRVLGSLAGDILGETVGVLFGEILGVADILGEDCAGADILRELGGVVRDSS